MDFNHGLLGDVNADGVLDAIFANTGLNERCIGNGTGSFTCTALTATLERTSVGVAVGELGSFGDSFADIVIANETEDAQICLGFTCFSITSVQSSTGVAIGDVDGDGDLESVFSKFLSANRVCNITTCTDASTLTGRFSGVALSDGRTFEEDFSGTVITNLEDEDNAYTVSGGKIKNTASTSVNDRHYIRTHVTDYNTVDFVAELTFTLTNDTGDMLHFFGLGAGIPDLNATDEPATGAYFRIHSPNTVSGRVDASFRNLTFAGSDGLANIGQMTNSGGTHRARLAKSGNELTFSMDVNFDGIDDDGDGSVFDAAFTYTVADLTAATAAPFLDNTNSRIFFGTASRIDTFDDFKVTAVVVADTTAPVVTVPSDITEEATSPDGADVTFSASATDDVDGSLTPSCTPSSGSTFPLDMTTEVRCEATDSSNNTGEAFFDVTVEDTTSPQFTSVPVDFEVGTTFENPLQALVEFQVSATDAVGATVTCVPSSGSLFPIGPTQVDCEANDAAGNPPATTSFNVTVLGFGDQVDALAELDEIDALPANIQRGLDNFLAFISRVGDSNPNSGIAVSGMLGSFQNQVRALVRSRRLSPENGDALISATETVRNNLDPRR